MTDPTLSHRAVQAAVRLALEEDIAQGDVTTDAVVPRWVTGSASFVARVPMVLCGLPVVREVFAQVDPAIELEPLVREGSRSRGKGEVLARLRGPLHSILTGERVALNFLQRMSGIATRTASFVDLLGDRTTRLVDTRKTTPGIRALERYAVRVGGGRNHRYNLADGILIKDNHIKAAGGVREAVSGARATGNHLLAVEIEVADLDQLAEALDCGVDAVLLDNMDDAMLAQAVALTRERPGGGRITLEASGNMTAERIGRIKDLGLDIVSMGGLIHQATWADLSMKFVDG